MKKLLIAAVALSLALCGCSSAGGQVNTQETPAPVSEATAAPTEAPTPEPKSYKVGDTIQAGGFNITLLSLETKDEIGGKTMMGYTQTESPEEGQTFVVAYLKVENTGEKSAAMNNKPVTLSLLYNGKYKYDQYYPGSYGDLYGEDIQPLAEKTGYFPFNVPKKVATSGEEMQIIVYDYYDEVASFTATIEEPENDPVSVSGVSAIKEPTDYVSVGEPADFGDFTITATGIGFEDKIYTISDYYYIQAEEGYKIATVFLDVKNNGNKEEQLISSLSYRGPEVKLIYGGKYEYTPTSETSYSKDLHFKAIDPLGTISGALLFKVPDVVADSSESLVFQILEGPDHVSFVLR